MLKLNLQFFAEESTEIADNIDDFIDSIDFSDDEQPEQDSEETVEETEEVEEEVTEDEVEPDSDDEEQQDETEEETEESDEESEGEESEDDEEAGTELSDETEIDLGDDKNPVTLKELKDGYLRQSDYTKKTQALAEERKEIESLQEEVKPVQEWLDWWSSNPYLREQITSALQEWENTGVLPLEQVIQESSSGKYINHLLSENKRLQDELDKTSSEFESTKFESEMRTLESDLKAEYGELADADYLDTLRQRGKDEGLSYEVLKEIADGQLAKKQLEQEKKNSKKAVAKAKQKQKSKRLPPQPKSKGQTPKEPTKKADSWAELFGVED